MSPFLDLNGGNEEQEKSVTFRDVGLIKALIPYARPHWRYLLLSLLLLPLISGTQILQPIILKQAIDGPIAYGDIAGLLKLALLFLLLMLLHYGLRYIQMLLAQITGQRIILTLRSSLYDHLQSLPVGFYHKTPLGKLITRISSDVENVSEVFASGGIAILSDILVILSVIAAMFAMNIPLALVIVCIIPLVVFNVEFFRRRSRAAYNMLRVQLAEINSTLQEMISGMEVVQLHGRERRNTALFENFGRKFMKTNLRSVVYDSSFTASLELLSFAALLLVIGYVAWQQSAGIHSAITLGVLMAFLQYIQMLFEPIEEFSDRFTIVQSGLASLEKIMELMEVKPAIVSPACPVSLPRASGHIRFENVWFGYTPDEPVLKNLNLEIEPGAKVALIGSTGAGKSTLVKLLNRQYEPQKGRILIDGVDIQQYALADLRRNIVIIPQEEFLFSRTVEENITLAYKETASRERLHSIASRLHAGSVMERLPDGYQSLLPERGRNLSHGERQLLVFARALWHDPAIIILDEATSSVDPQTERLLQNALEQTLSGRTAVVVAHRLSTVQQADLLYVIENGEIAESGTPDELYHRNGLYRFFHNHHFAEDCHL